MSDRTKRHELDLTAFDTTSLGSLIAALERCTGTAQVRFGFGYEVPRKLDSYRGYYEHLALGYSDTESGWPTVAGLLAELREAIGSRFTGWKGGTYTMGLSTPVWVANPGSAASTTIVAVLDEGDYQAVILTGYAP